MIRITTHNNQVMYQAYHLVKAFYPDQEVIQDRTTLHQDNKLQEPYVTIQFDGSCFSISETLSKEETTRNIYRYLSQRSGKELPWGILTGVRPTKLFYEQTGKQANLIDYMCDRYFISQEKAELCVQVIQQEHKILSDLSLNEGVSFYIGIPFCPSICSYCSFGSMCIQGQERLVEQYLSALMYEIEQKVRNNQKQVHTIYIGGGTPTSLSAGHMNQLLSHICQVIPMKDVIEFTVEAGRPDTITREKLEILRNYPVTRIAINPQSMNQNTLDRIGRSHTAEDVTRAFHLARELGFDSINMDLIVGLGETVEEFKHTLSEIGKLQPDGITIHSLAIKRASQIAGNRNKSGSNAQVALVCKGDHKVHHKVLSESIETQATAQAHHVFEHTFNEELDYTQADKNITQQIEEMLRLAGTFVRGMQMQPYYLYRQKNIAGNFENVGYAKVDKAGRYNILIMEDKQTILACGAAAVTKYVLPEKVIYKDRLTHIIRESNPKDVREYIKRMMNM